MDNKVSIVLLNYKGLEDTIECIESLKKCMYSNFDIIVVDNASPDDSYQGLVEYIGSTSEVAQKNGTTSEVEENKVILLEAEKNGGFAKGNNIGIKYALDNGAEYILLLNNDTVVEPNFIEELLKPFVKSSLIGLTTGKICYSEERDKIWFAGGKFLNNRFYGAHIGEGEIDNGRYDRGKEITFATGCLMMIRASVLKKTGYLPEEYFMYYEDVDFCLKLRDSGYKIWFTPEAKIYHKISASTGGEASAFAIKWNTRNRILLMRKYKNKISKAQYIKLNGFFYGTRIGVIGKYLLKGQLGKASAVIKGVKNSLH